MAEKFYKEERFEFALYVNNNLVCKRNFKINNFIDHSMSSVEFKEAIDGIVDAIDNDLKSKSRVYTWCYGDVSNTYQKPLEEFTDPLIEPWACTFKFIVTDRRKPVIEKIWDGRFYPKAIRDKVDIANKTVKISKKGGRTFSYDKNTFFADNSDRLSPELYCLRGMIMDKPDLLSFITKRICEICSPRENGFKRVSDYTFIEPFDNDPITKAESGNNARAMKYNFNLDAINKRVESIWGKVVSEKTKEYLKTLY